MLFTLIDLIKKTQKDIPIIKKEYQKFRDFQLQNPWIIKEMINDITVSKRLKKTAPPTFEEIVAFKDEYLVDSCFKIFRQIKGRNPYFRNIGGELILFYSIEKNLYRRQLKEGFELGEKDNRGRLVTGSDLTINSTSINIEEFLCFYYTTNN